MRGVSTPSRERQVPSSSSQQGLLFGTSSGRPWANVEQVVIHLDIAPELDVLSAAWAELVRRHDALRMFWVDGSLWETDELKLTVVQHDWSKLDAETQRDCLAGC